MPHLSEWLARKKSFTHSDINRHNWTANSIISGKCKEHNKLRPLCPTRFTYREKAVSKLLGQYEEVVAALEALSTGPSHAIFRAHGLYIRMQDGFIRVFLELSLILISSLTVLNKKLQSSSCTILEMKASNDACMTYLQSVRDNADEHIKMAISHTEEKGYTLSLPRQKHIPSRFGSGTECTFNSTNTLVLHQFVQALDSAMQQLNERLVISNFNVFIDGLSIKVKKSLKYKMTNFCMSIGKHRLLDEQFTFAAVICKYTRMLLIQVNIFSNVSVLFIFTFTFCNRSKFKRLQTMKR